MSGQIVFIMWRESVEALLVVGILFTWLRHNAPGSGAGRYLWGGVVAGVVLALLLAAAIFYLSAWLPAGSQDYFMAAMMLIAAVLIVQMVFWMRAHGRRLRGNLEAGLHTAVTRRRWWGIFALALIAVGREGSETVVFIFGALSSGSAAGRLAVSGSIMLGFAAAFATFWVLQLGGRHLSWRVFFRATEIMLLLLGCALAVSAADKLIALGILPFARTVWDTSWLLDDGSRVGGVVAALTGYRAAPDWVTLSVWGVYWGVIAVLMRVQLLATTVRVKAAHPQAK